VTPRGSLFVVRDGGRVVAALTGAKPTVGLVFYDLKTCLRMLEREEAKAEKAEPAPAAKATETKPRVGKAASTRPKTSTKKKEEAPDEGS